MKNRLLIPLAVALTLHALLLFGLQTGEPLSRLSDPEKLAVLARSPETVVVDLSPSTEEANSSLRRNGEPDVASSNLREPEPRHPNSEFTISRQAPSVASIPSVTSLTDPRGNPNGFLGLRAGDSVGSDRLDNPPRARSQVAPVYPYEARKDGRPAEVLVEFVVDEKGHVADPHVVRSTDSRFEESTLRAVAKWRFDPGRKDGRVVRFRMAVPVSFAINS